MVKHRPHLFACLACLAMALFLPACQRGKTGPPPSVPPAPPALTYAELAEQYNTRIAAVQTLWVRSVVEIRWTDADGKRHFEQGDGPLIIRKPSELALAIGKAGHTRFWLGCNAQHYWLFDLGDEKLAYVGKQDEIARTRQNVLPLPIRPDQLIGLIGLRPLPATDSARVTPQAGLYHVKLPPDPQLGGLRPELWLDRELRLVRMKLFDGTPRVIVDATLDNYARMKLDDQPPGAWPWLPERLNLALEPGDDAPPANRVTIFMRNPTAGAGKIKDVQFNFERLVKALKADQVIEIKPER